VLENEIPQVECGMKMILKMTERSLKKQGKYVKESVCSCVKESVCESVCSCVKESVCSYGGGNAEAAHEKERKRGSFVTRNIQIK
jgi:hypothetical protein